MSRNQTKILEAIAADSRITINGLSEIVGIGTTAVENNLKKLKSKGAIERMMQESPELERRLYRQALDELDEARDWMVTLGRKTASEKIASLLLMIAHHAEPSMVAGRNSARFDLPLTRADIADFLGLTIETVSRQLTRLRNEKIISIENNRLIIVLDLRRLKARAGNS